MSREKRLDGDEEYAMTTTAAVDLYSPDTYVAWMPHETFEMLRRQSPVFWQDEPEGPGYWALL